MNDWQLLQDYTARGSEAAFRTLVDRYLSLVHSAARRQVRDSQLAEEVSQAVFILLARKAAGLPRGVVLAGWLFRTTRFVAARALRAEHRRQRREQEAFAMQQLATPDPTWRQIAPALDEALAQLGETDRNAVLLRYFQDRNHKEVGAALGLNEEAARKRVNRALEKLRRFFAGRGFTLSASVLASALAAHAAQAAPAELANRVAAASVAAAAAPTLPALVGETLQAWRWAKLKLAGALVATLGTIGLGLFLWPGTPGGPSPRAASPNPLQSSAAPGVPAAGSRPVPAARAKQAREQVLRFRVVAKDTGQAAARAQLAVNTVSDGQWRQRFDLATDEAGLAEVSYPANVGRLDVGVVSWGWVARFATWTPERTGPIPADYTLQVDRVTNALSGWLRDAEGRPVANAEIWASFGGTGDRADQETPRERFGFASDVLVARSDAKGWWTCAIVPTRGPHGVELKARHPDFQPTFVLGSSWEGGPEPVVTEKQQLAWAGKLITKLETGSTLRGRVLDEKGQPIAKALVTHAPFTMRPLVVETDAQGGFSLSGLERNDYSFTVSAPGFAPEHREVAAENLNQPVELRLKPGARLRLLLVDEQGVPVPEAEVGLEQWGELRQELKWNAESAADGRLEWDSAPREAQLELYARKAGWCYTRNIQLQADGKEHVIEMRRALVVTGRVTDATTGQPIAEMKAVPGYGEGEDVWERLETRHSTNGTFSVNLEEFRDPWRVRVEAAGYVPFVSEPLRPDFTGSLEVALQPLDLAKSVRGVVWQPDRQPAAGAEVALLTLEHTVCLEQARFRREPSDKLVVTADAQGRFSFAPDPKAHTLVAVSREGYARVRLRDPRQPVSLQLQPWGLIQGAIEAPVRAQPVQSVRIAVDCPDPEGEALSLALRPAELDQEGRFSFEFVPPDTLLCLSLCPGIAGAYYHHQTWVTLSPGQTASLLITNSGWGVKGRLVMANGRAVQWPKAAIAENGLEWPKAPRRLKGAARKLWFVDFWNSEAGRQYMMNRISKNLDLAADGSFSQPEGLPPGTYRIRALIGGSMAEAKITLPAPAEGGYGILDLGQLSMALDQPRQN